MESILGGLNPNQRAAVTTTVPVLQILAPPGSGKTKTLTARVAYLLDHHGFQPANVICCTFTRKASQEMRERVVGVVGEKLGAQLLMGTFHSLCCRYLRRYGQMIGLPANFGVADTTASQKILKKVIESLKATVELGTCKGWISRRKAKAESLPQNGKPAMGQKAKVLELEMKEVFDEYQRQLGLSSLLDYDDLLVQTVRLLRAHPVCVANVEAVLIDEFQDTNIIQLELMKLFASKNCCVTVVGDPDQSIYGFRSAETLNLTRMKQYFIDNGIDCLVINLEENYRSAAAVLRVAQKIIEQDSSRPSKSLKATHKFGTLPVLRKLPSARDEAEWIASEIRRVKAMTGGLTTFSDYAILLRSNSLSMFIEKEFTKAKIPYQMIGSNPFFDREEIRILLNYLRTVSHPDNNTSLSAIINTPSRKIGEETLLSFLRVASEKNISLWDAVQKVTKGQVRVGKTLSRPAEQELCKLIRLIDEARQLMHKVSVESTAHEVLQFWIQKLDYKKYLTKRFPKSEEFETKWANVEELISFTAEVAQGGSASLCSDEELPIVEGAEQRQTDPNEEALSSFLANIVISTPDKKSDSEEERDCVSVLTIHTAKGLEWPIVFVPAVYNGSIPHSRAEDSDEERRLLYVAMTRAKALLYLSYPSRLTREEGTTNVSMFLTPDLGSYFSSSGPVIGAKVVRDMANILRRDLPSDEDLDAGIKSLSGTESSRDDIWPLDGSDRQKKWWETHDGVSGSLEETHQSLPPFRPRNGVGSSLISTVIVETSMSRLAAESMGSGFSSAAALHKVSLSAPQPTEEKRFEEQPSQTAKPKPRGKKVKDENQRDLTSFFTRASSDGGAEVKPVPVSSKANIYRTTSALEALKAEPNVALPESNHRISTKPNSFKRPRYDSDESLSKHPRLESGSVPAGAFREPLNRVDLNASSLGQRYPPLSSHPAPSLHLTSMDLIRQRRLNAGKQLGVRRSHTGWQDRKHK